jgi:hypothetical protein
VIDIVLRRFAEYHDLEGAFGGRAVTERAKGILMERHSVDEADAFGMLRDHSRRTKHQSRRRRRCRRRLSAATQPAGHLLLSRPALARVPFEGWFKSSRPD